MQLGIEYDPQPLFRAGSPEKAPAVVEMLRGGFEGLRAEQRGRRAGADHEPYWKHDGWTCTQ